MGDAPEGWRLVPEKPTHAMIHAYCEAQDAAGVPAFANARTIWPLMLAAAPSLPQPDGWRPIESAPRDKTFVALLRVSSDGSTRYGVGWYMPLYGWRNWFGDAPPTHWSPLPPPPVSSSTGENGDGH